MVMPEGFSIIDSHCHLDRFFHRGELEDVLKSAREAGVDRVITIGTNEDDWGLYEQLAAEHPGIIDYTVGLHPCNVDENWESQVERIISFFSSSQACPVGLGEIGLDNFHLPKKDLGKAEKLKQMQQAALRAQLDILKELDCPVVIHSRGAFEECIEELDVASINWDKVVFHCFVEDAEAIAALNSRGGRGSFTGIITFKNANSVREAALAQSVHNLMVETDAPYLAPEPFRGKPCLPAYAALTARYCANLLDLEENELAQITRENTESFFKLD